MNTKRKSNQTITTETGDQRITWRVEGAGSLTLDLSKLSPDILARAAMHGLVQRVSDGAALSRDPDTGLPATPADKLAAMKRIVDHYESGTAEWALRVATGEGRVGGVTLQALADVQGCTVAEARERVEALAEKRGVKTAEILREVAKAKAVAKRIAEIRSANAPDADDLLGELA